LNDNFKKEFPLLGDQYAETVQKGALALMLDRILEIIPLSIRAKIDCALIVVHLFFLQVCMARYGKIK
jgi:hypothetical protein